MKCILIIFSLLLVAIPATPCCFFKSKKISPSLKKEREERDEREERERHLKTQEKQELPAKMNDNKDK